MRRSTYSGRSDDNIESIKLRFDTFKAETLPLLGLFKSKGRCIEIDTSLDRQAVYKLVLESLTGFTDQAYAKRPLTE